MMNMSVSDAEKKDAILRKYYLVRLMLLTVSVIFYETYLLFQRVMTRLFVCPFPFGPVKVKQPILQQRFVLMEIYEKPPTLSTACQQCISNRRILPTCLHHFFPSNTSFAGKILTQANLVKSTGSHAGHFVAILLRVCCASGLSCCF